MNFDYHVVGFLDILGFSAMVEADSRSSTSRFLPIFVEVFEELSKMNNAGSPTVRMFSDSILVEAKLSPENIIRVLEISGDLQRLFLRKGILIRGGVAYGKHFSSQSVTFSQALIDAYQIESKQARFPRVVIGKDVLSFAWHHQTITEQMRERIKNSVRIDRDGANFVDYLNTQELNALTDHIQHCINVKSKPNENVLEKMRWLLDYHNHCADNLGLAHADAKDLHAGFSHFEKIC